MAIKLKKNSSRHHYLPVFFIKNFADENNNFYVLDKETLKVKKKVFNPKQIFYEWDDNTSSLGGLNVDFMENVYAKIDNNHSILLKILANSKPNEFILTEKVLDVLREFISTTFWRSPSNNSLLNRILDENDFNTLGLSVIDQTTNKPITDTNKIRKIFADDTFRKLSKGQISLINKNAENKTQNNLKWNILYFQSHKVLLNDNPIIHRKEVKTKNDVMNELILPISSNKLLFSVESYKNKVSDYFLTYTNLLSIQRANKFIISRDKDYLLEISEAYNKLKTKDSREFIKKVFEFINLK